MAERVYRLPISAIFDAGAEPAPYRPSYLFGIVIGTLGGRGVQRAAQATTRNEAASWSRSDSALTVRVHKDGRTSRIVDVDE